MATAGNGDTNSVAESSPSMDMHHRAPTLGKNRFAALVEADDNDDEVGGVVLKDFDEDEDDNDASSVMGTSHHGGAPLGVYGKQDFSSGPANQPAGFARRNTIAPIGTGRFSEYTANTDVAAALDANLDALLKANAQKAASLKANGQNMTAGQVGAANFNAVAPQYAVGATSGVPSQTTATQAQFNRTPGPKGHANMTGATVHAAAMAYPYTASTMRYPYGTIPIGYNPGADAYMAQQASANVPRMNTHTTPSHAPRNGGMQQMATPGSALGHNQTEPRNFAPRAGAIPVYLPPPPQFNIGHGAAVTKQHGSSQASISDSDPFSSSPLTSRTSGSAASQGLVLPSVPEENQLALVPTPVYGPVPTAIRAVRSEQLNKLTDGPTGLPTFELAVAPENFPFMESASQAAPVSHGVIKIKNIPFGTKRAEIVAFLGRNSKILNDNQEPVHIIMERVSSKTQDCYVEFLTLQDATRAVERHQTNIQKGRLSRLGDRPVDVQLSSQSALMRDLFPLASGVFWDGPRPVIQDPIEGQPWKTFKGFVTEEEMAMLVKHVEMPHRSPYSKECPQRPYECMISTLKKLPWYMVDDITLRQRHAVYNATEKLVVLLVQALQIENPMHEMTINEQLLKRLVTAAMLCPGFSVVQKDNIAAIAHLEDGRARLFNQPRFANMWTHLYALCPKPGLPLDLLEWYVAVIREETTRRIYGEPLDRRNEIQHIGSYTELYFGYIWYEMGLVNSQQEFDKLTLRGLARRELAAIENILRRALPGNN